MAIVSFSRLAALAGSAALSLLLAAPVHAQDAQDASAQTSVRVAQADNHRGSGRWQQRAARAENRAEARAERQAGREWRGGGEQPAVRAERRAARMEQRASRMEQRAARIQQQGAAPTRDWRVERQAQSRREDGGWQGDRAGARTRSWRGNEAGIPASGSVEQQAWRQDRSGTRTIDRPDRDLRQRDWTRSNRDYTGQRGGYRQDERYGARRDGNREAYRGSRYDGGSSYRRSGGGWNTDWRRDRRYDWSSYRSYNRDAFRLGRYYSPYRNYSYRRLNIGLFLEPVFYGNRYWIADPWQYRLPEVDGPYRWVRYYDDVLLIDVYSGEVVDVIHDFFW